MSMSDRAKSNMEVVLEEICSQLPNGGDHEQRKLVAERLLGAAQAGHHTLSELGAVALQAFTSIE